MPKIKTNQYHEAVGRRKSAVARIRLYVPSRDKSAMVEGAKLTAGDFRVNKKAVDEVFSNPAQKVRYLTPLRLTDSEGRFIISAHIAGGGQSSQLDALIHGLARALEKVNKDDFRPVLKKEGLLTRDARERERRKVGTGGRARRQKQSPKR